MSRPQDRVLRRTVQQIVDAVPSLPTLDDPAPHTVQDIMHFFDTLTPDPEQVIEVPKILPDDVPTRIAVRDTQLAEKLVEVPKIVSFSLLQRIVEQIVDIPGGGLQDFRPGQSSSSSSHHPARAYDALDAPGDGGFLALFPKEKSAKIGPNSGSELSARKCQPIHAGSSAPCSSQAVGHDLG